jgi:hypothetical protein
MFKSVLNYLVRGPIEVEMSSLRLDRENYNGVGKTAIRLPATKGHYFCYWPTQDFHYGQPRRTGEDAG